MLIKLFLKCRALFIHANNTTGIPNMCYTYRHFLSRIREVNTAKVFNTESNEEFGVIMS